MTRPKKSSGAKSGAGKRGKPAAKTAGGAGRSGRRPNQPKPGSAGTETAPASGRRLYGARPAGGTGRDGVGRDAIGFGRAGPKPAGRASGAGQAGPVAKPPAPTKTKQSAGQAGAGQAAPKGRRPTREAPQLDAPAPEMVFKDRDGEAHRFPDSSLKRVAARLLTSHRKRWRYRPFGFPIFMPSGQEQTLNFDFVVYDNQEAVIRVILVAARDSAEVWDKIGRFKQQYPMYTHEIWTPERLADLSKPRARLGF